MFLYLLFPYFISHSSFFLAPVWGVKLKCPDSVIMHSSGRNPPRSHWILIPLMYINHNFLFICVVAIFPTGASTAPPVIQGEGSSGNKFPLQRCHPLFEVFFLSSQEAWTGVVTAVAADVERFFVMLSVPHQHHFYIFSYTFTHKLSRYDDIVDFPPLQQ